MKLFDVWKFPRGRMTLYVFGPIRFGFQIRDRWKFRLQAPLRSEIGIRFCGVLIDYFKWSAWLYVPSIFIPPPPAAMKKWYRIPKGKR